MSANPRFHRAWNWAKANLFSSKLNTVITLLVIAILAKIVWAIIPWATTQSIFNGSAQTCRQADGACWAFIKAKWTYILFGPYPRELLWRPVLMIFWAIGLFVYVKKPSRWNKKSVFISGLSFLGMGFLMRGGLFLKPVETHYWGGLPLTLILSSVGILASYPWGIVLALARRSKMPVIKATSAAYIELIRGVPLIGILFMASVMMPLFLPEGMVINKLFRAQVAIILFSGAYMAEVVRGGLQAIDKGQYEAAQSLGLKYHQTMGLIILPQALKLVIPPTVNTAIGLFKDTSLVIIIALFDLMYTTKSSLTDSNWLGFSVEAYLFVAVIYFFFCYSMGRYSRQLEAMQKAKSHH